MYERSIGDESREGTKDDTLVIVVGLVYICLQKSDDVVMSVNASVSASSGNASDVVGLHPPTLWRKRLLPNI